MKFLDKINKMFFNDYFMIEDDKIISEYVLSEARGVSMFPYRYYIDEIYKYVVDKIKVQAGKINSEKQERCMKMLTNDVESVNGKEQTDSDFDFWLPQKLLKPFTFVKELHVHIIASQYKDDNTCIYCLCEYDDGFMEYIPFDDELLMFVVEKKFGIKRIP